MREGAGERVGDGESERGWAEDEEDEEEELKGGRERESEETWREEEREGQKLEGWRGRGSVRRELRDELSGNAGGSGHANGDRCGRERDKPGFLLQHILLHQHLLLHNMFHTSSFQQVKHR